MQLARFQQVEALLLQAVAKILMPLGGPRLREAVSQAFTGTFQIYTNAITAHFSRYRDAEGALPKELGTCLYAHLTLGVSSRCLMTRNATRM